MKTNSLLLAAILSIISFQVKSQDTTRINAFAGIVGSGFVQTDSGYLIKWANVRAGVRYQEKLFGKISYDGRIGFDPGDNNVIFYSALKSEWKNFGISVGYQPTPVSEMRPTPLSVDGQFQFTAQAMPPGGTLGTTANYKNIKAGFYIRNKKAEYQLVYKYKIITFGVWTNTVDSINCILGGATAKVELPYLYAMASFTANNQQALALSICPVKELGYRAIWDLAITDKKITSNLVGIMKFLKVKKISDARFGVGYDFVNKSVGAFFLLGFNYKE